MLHNSESVIKPLWISDLSPCVSDLSLVDQRYIPFVSVISPF